MRRLSPCLLLLAGLCLPLPLPAEPHAQLYLPDGQPLLLELADTPASRQQGLMGRRHLASGHGMLFDYPRGARPNIWMKNMHIPLDLLFIDGQGRILQVHADIPPCRQADCPTYPGPADSRFALELPAGSLQRHGLHVGQRLALDAFTQRPRPE